jgi:hypothetical protein
MTEPANYSIRDDIVLTTYGKQPCPHCYDRREFRANLVYWTLPRAIVLALAGIKVAVCATCITEQEISQDWLLVDANGTVVHSFQKERGEHEPA